MKPISLYETRDVNLRGNLLEQLPDNLSAYMPACKTLNIVENPLISLDHTLSVLAKLPALRCLHMTIEDESAAERVITAVS